MPDRLGQLGLLTRGQSARARPGIPAARRLSALALILGTLAFAPGLAAAGVFSFARTDYLLESHLNGLDSVAVGDLDGVNGPDIVVLSYTAGGSQSTVNVLLNNGDGTFADAQPFE